MISQTKSQFRLQMLRRLRRQEEVKRLIKSFQIQKKLFSLFEFIKAKTILFYLSFDAEVETFRMIDKAILENKKVAVPVIDKHNRALLPSLIFDCGYNLEVGPYGIYQPSSPYRRTLSINKLDMIVVPAVAFDLEGNRLGRGLGYYDRFLNSLPRRIPTVGLAFDFQVLKRLPFVESHDFCVDKVLYA